MKKTTEKKLLNLPKKKLKSKRRTRKRGREREAEGIVFDINNSKKQ
jgi:hypothetical protein